MRRGDGWPLNGGQRREFPNTQCIQYIFITCVTGTIFVVGWPLMVVHVQVYTLYIDNNVSDKCIICLISYKC